LGGKRAKCEKKEKLGNLREIGEEMKVGFGSFLKIRESCPLIRRDMGNDSNGNVIIGCLVGK